MNYTRENQDFWLSFTKELTEEINSKGLLNPYVEKISTTKKKEDGHSFAQSFVEYLVSEVLPQCEVLGKYGFTVEDSVKEREHGDFYLVNKTQNIKILIRSNGKLGLSDKLGQPNMCSIVRAIDYLHKNNLPYLVFKLRKVKGVFHFNIFDLFNFVDVVSYNDGPGQLMISESKFYNEKEFKYLKTSQAIYLIYMKRLF